MILLIDDDPTLEPLVTGLLSAGGEGMLDVTAAGTLTDGLELLRNAEHCVILLDLRLPDSDGLQTLAACHAARPGDTPIIVLTAEGDRALAVAALREGADDFLLKTELTPQTLARAIRYAIERAAHRLALRAMELRAGAVLESIDSLIGLIDDRGVLLQVNSAWRSFAERSGCPVLGAPLGCKFIDFCSGMNHPLAALFVAEARQLLGGEKPRFEETLSCETSPDHDLTIRVRGASVDLPAGRAMAIVIDDLTQKVRFERQINAYAERLTVAIEAGHVGTWDWDLRTNRVEWSPWHYRIFGLSHDQFEGTAESFYRSVHPDDRGIVSAHIVESRTTRSPYRATHRIVRPDGAVRWVEAQGRFLFSDSGEPIRMSGAVVDITDRHLASARHVLSQRLEALGELSAGISHDLRNTLTLANAAIATLESATGLDSRSATAVADLRLAMSQAGQLAGSLIDFAQPRRIEPSQVVDLNNVCMGFVALLRRLLPRGLRLVAECGREPAAVVIAPVHVQQVLMNLVLNARDAMGGEGEIRVRVTPGAHQHILEVSDNGPGIANDVQTHLFEPFYTAKADGEGSGLGLTIVKTILDGSGGSIEVDSAPGRGATFRLRWPASHASLTSDRERGLASTAVEAKATKSIAIIQTDDYARRILADGLGEAGYTVYEADRVESAEAVIRRGDLQPAVLVIDDALLRDTIAGGTSLEECRRRGIARLRGAGCAGPVILITAGDVEDGEEYFAISKPFSVGQVCAAVRAMLEDELPVGPSDEGQDGG